MANRGLTDISVTKTWRDGRAYFESYVDALKNAIGNVSSITNLNLIQLGKDISPSYSFTNNGTASLSKSLQEQINDIQSGGVPITGTTSNDFTIRSASNYLKFNASTLTTPVVLTAPDGVSGEIVVDANVGRSIGVHGLGITYSAGVFTICKDDGSALSDTNYGWAVMPSTTTGLITSIKVTANATFNDDTHASSSIVGVEFETTSGVAWAEQKPFFIYAVNSDDTSAGLVFGLSPNPSLIDCPDSDHICYKGALPVLNNVNNIFIMSSDAAVLGYGGSDVLRCGYIEMTKSTADDWTVTTLATQLTGFNKYPWMFSRQFQYPSGHNGNTSGKYLSNNGGTAPVFSVNTTRYFLSSDGFVSVYLNLSGDGGTDGVGAVSAIIGLPYTPSTGSPYAGSRFIGEATYGATTDAVIITDPSDIGKICNIATPATPLTNGAFIAGSRQINLFVRYMPFV